ncbi:Aldo-keto reductase dtxS3 [Lachnellula arida]|uniref:Aldo-keto reductase dtxS3 n=2 Tax=Lachnellula TaxID=47830 RepID=A0A8T9B4X4_9HELO|nr:Aldo-keto reductase dtxS3 [Lachnellula arida]TVY94048.1 Aldo-keto reductase [Lachnellula willkommii]
MPPPPPPVPASLQKSIDDTKVEYVQLGTSGLRVSSPILGTMGIGSKQWTNWVIEEEEGLQVLKMAWDRGLTTWDTANVYSSGVNEEIVGKAIKKFNIPREKITLLAKIRGTVPEEPGVFNWMFEEQMAKSKDYVNKGGLSRGAIFKAVNASLKRLGTDYIDLLQIHRYDPSVPPAETMKALHDLVESGKVHYIGASSMWTYQFASLQFTAEKHGWTKFVSMQNRYNLLYREEEREMMRFCKETGVGVIPWGPLANGLLAKPFGEESARSAQSIMMSGGTTEADRAINGRVREVAEKKGWKMSQVAMAWVKGRGAIPIVGLSSTSVERLDDTCKLRDLELSEDDMKYLEEPYVPKPVAGHT